MKLKYILSALCITAALLASAGPAYAATDTAKSSYYPIAVEEYLEGDAPRINKTYQLSLLDDPACIPTEDFVRDGRLYYLLDMTRRSEVGVDIIPYTQAVTLDSDTEDMESILQMLDGELETTTQDGYTGTLRLDHTTVQVEAAGWTTKTRTVSATRIYPGLSDADVALIPKTVSDSGRTLELADVQWESSIQTGAEGTVQRWCATATYTGTASSRYATGYTVTANYTGEVAKTDCSVMIYTAVFGSVELPKEPDTPEVPDATEQPGGGDDPAPTEPAAESPSGLKGPLLIGGVVLVVAAAGVFVFKKIRERR